MLGLRLIMLRLRPRKAVKSTSAGEGEKESFLANYQQSDLREKKEERGKSDRKTIRDREIWR